MQRDRQTDRQIDAVPSMCNKVPDTLEFRRRIPPPPHRLSWDSNFEDDKSNYDKKKEKL